MHAGRDKENRTIREIDSQYRNGDIEILPDRRDPGIVKIMPLKKKKLPEIESIDGLYFFLRKRPDLNQKIIITMRKDSYMVALNTQDKAELAKYDFNALLEKIYDREKEIISAEYRKTGNERDTLKNVLDLNGEAMTEEERKKLQAKVRAAQLKKMRIGRDLIKLKQGGLWRNRTQMVFSNKSYIPVEKFLDIVSDWKKAHEGVNKTS